MPWLVHVAGQQKPTQHCKNIIPQTKNTFLKSEIIFFATNGILKHNIICTKVKCIFSKVKFKKFSKVFQFRIFSNLRIY